MNHELYMKRALEISFDKNRYQSPNPMVGAVIVKDDRIISQGFHKIYGDVHAEVDAIQNATENLEGSTMYVTLEPCSHQGKQPPCVKAIIDAKISKVVVGTLDPNPKVAGKGIKFLKDNNVEVVVGVLEEECKKINEIFFHYIKTNKPFVAMKYAMTLDGKIQTYTGKSKWISSEESRFFTHELRSYYSAIMVGIQTVLLDDPMLNCRTLGRNPVRIICDTNLRIPIESKIVQSAKEYKTIVATSSNNMEKIEELKKHSVEVINVTQKDNHIDLDSLLEKLASIGIDSILLEGGSTLNWSFLKENLVNKVYAFVSLKLFGGELAKGPIGGIGVESPSLATEIINPKYKYFGNDLLIEGDVKCLQE